MTWILGWRNLWRNPKRSLITIAAIASAYGLLIGMIGLMAGVARQMLNNGTGLMLSHVQVHHTDYLPDRNLHDVFDYAKIATAAEDMGLMEFSPRVQTFGLLSTGEHSAGGQLLGISRRHEASVSQLLDGLDEATVESFGDRNAMLLGEALARELRATKGSEIAVVTQAADGSLGNDLFIVAGTIRTGLRQLDRSLAVVPRPALTELLALDSGTVHEVAIRIDDPMQAEVIARQLTAAVSDDQLAVASWQELSPQLRDYVGMSQGVYLFLIGLVGLFVAIGILNTMMMALFDRTREIGMLLALGMKPLAILGSILAECMSLCVVGIVTGIAFGGALHTYFATRGLDLSAWTGELSMINSRFDPIIFSVWNSGQVSQAAIGFAFAGLVATLIPAWRAVRMDPVEAMARGGVE